MSVRRRARLEGLAKVEENGRVVKAKARVVKAKARAVGPKAASPTLAATLPARAEEPRDVRMEGGSVSWRKLNRSRNQRVRAARSRETEQAGHRCPAPGLGNHHSRCT
jgi:hypothetical protein